MNKFLKFAAATTIGCVLGAVGVECMYYLTDNPERVKNLFKVSKKDGNYIKVNDLDNKTQGNDDIAAN